MSDDVNEAMSAHYKCDKCGHKFTAPPGPVWQLDGGACLRCSSKYVRWLDYPIFKLGE